MKKFVSILLLIFYLLPSIGFSLDLHWCGKKVKIVAVNSSHKNRCECKTKKAMPCCKDVHLTVKITDNQNTSSQLNAPQNNFILQLNSSFSQLVFIPSSQVEGFSLSTSRAPPFKTKLPVYLANNLIRI